MWHLRKRPQGQTTDPEHQYSDQEFKTPDQRMAASSDEPPASDARVDPDHNKRMYELIREIGYVE